MVSRKVMYALYEDKSENEQLNASGTQEDEELDDLTRGKVLLPPNSVSKKRNSVVVVHEGVDSAVEEDQEPSQGNLTNHKQEHDTGSNEVVVDVKEGQWLLTKSKNDGVNKLVILRQVEN
jgi:hypothetical protein